ncbi:MAG: hypothetical protein ACLRRT_06135 [Ruthenibacterium lactatiformans]
MQKQHTVLCIQDLSCVGRCSLAVVLPALAAMGVQPCALPTALLSTHTGGLGRPARTDESGFISAALAHYAQLGLAFDCMQRLSCRRRTGGAGGTGLPPGSGGAEAGGPCDGGSRQAAHDA